MGDEESKEESGDGTVRSTVGTGLKKNCVDAALVAPAAGVVSSGQADLP